MKFVNLFVSSLIFLTSYAYGDAVIFSGNDVKTLKPNIDLFGQGKILSGSTDPTSVATSAPIGSIYLNTSNGNLYRKVDAGSSTNWQKVGSAAVAGNLLPNPDWETGTAGWTASAGSYARTTTAADVGFGAGSGSFDASATSQTLTSTAVAIPTGLYASNGLASCYIKTAASDYIMQVYDGTNVIGSATIAARTQYTRTNVNFIFPSSGNISLRISSQSNAAIMYMDDCYVGPATNISQVSQASFFGSTRISGMSANWSVSGTGVQDFPAIASATYTVAGNALSPTTNIPAIRFTNLPPGTYQIIARAAMTQGASAGQCYYRLWDGSSYIGTDMLTTAANQENPGPLTGSVTYSTTQSDITFRIRMRDQSLANNCLIRSSAWNDLQVEFQVYRFPSSSELAVSANIPGAPTIQKFTSGSGTYTRPSGVKYLRVRMVGGGGGGSDGASRSGSDGGDTTFGTLTAARGKGAVGGGPSGSPGVASSGSSIGSFSGVLIEGSAGNAGMANAAGRAHGGGGGTSYFGGRGLGPQCESGTVNGGTAATNSGSGGGGGCSGASANAIQGHGGGAGGYVEVLIPNPSTTYSYSVGGSGAGAVNGGSGGAGYIEVTEFYGVLDVPILVGSVTSNSAGAERVERAKIRGGGASGVCNSSPCTISDQTGSWLSSVTRSTTGQYTINFAAGAFSAAPTCVISGGNNSNFVACLMGNPNGITTSVASVFCGNLSGAAGVDAAMELICMGPR